MTQQGNNGLPAAAGAAQPVDDDGSGDWVTRREAARLAGCSEDSIKRTVAKDELPTRTGLKGEVLVSVSSLVMCGRIAASAVPTGLTGPQAAELRRVTAELSRLTAQVGELTGRLAEVSSSRDLYRDQLSVKDEQIKQLMTVLARSAR
jgi:hypothetical protein